MKFRLLGKLLLIFTIGILITGCSGSKSTEEEKASEQAKENQAVSSGVLNIAVPAQPPTLDVQMTTATVAIHVTRNIYETLMTQNETFDAVPMLAESVDKSDDGTTFTFHLRKGVKFHNGKEMKAEDVVASMNRWLNLSSRAKMLLAGAVFEAEDDYTVLLKLKEYVSDALDIMAGQGQFPAIMPKEVIEAATTEGVTEYIGTGPFKFEEWKQDQYIHLVKFDDYQTVDADPSGFSGKKEALVDDLYYHIVTDTSTRMTGLQTGEYDVADSMSPDNYEQLKTMPDVKPYVYFSGSNVMFFNKKEGMMTNEKMRQGINAILDMDAIMIASFAHEDLYKMDPGYMNPDQANWSTDAGSKSYNQKDPEKGKKLLDEAGYNGEEINIIVTRDYDYNYNAGIVVKEELEKAGVKVNLQVYDWPTLLDRIKDPANWDIYFTGVGYVTTPSQLLALNSEQPGWPNDEKITNLLSGIRKAKTQDEAEALWEELQGYLWNEYVPISMFGHYTNIIGASDKLEGFKTFQGAIPWNTRVLK